MFKRIMSIGLMSALLLGTSAAVSGCSSPSSNMPQLNAPKKGDTKAVLKTSMGDITIVLFNELAPLTVENFTTHAKNGYYDGVIFHRVIKDFMIQSGDPEGTGRGGESIFGEPFKDEISGNLFHLRGALSMANPGIKDANGSQFFIVQSGEKLTNDYIERCAAKNGVKIPSDIAESYRKNGGTPHLDGKHTVFGFVVEGMDIVDAIADAAVDSRSSKPLKDITINNIEISTFE